MHIGARQNLMLESNFRRRMMAGMKLLSSALAFVAIAAIMSPSAAKSGPKCAAYVEVNNNSINNTGRYTLVDGSNVFDIAIIFASNINFNGTEAVVYHNPNVQKLLDNAETEIKPLQAQGIKVVLSILGGHTGVGVSNFASQKAATRFAGLVRHEILKYGLDGVDLDDEYAEYGKNGTARPNKQSIGWLISALRANMPEKLITFYNWGPAATALSSSNSTIGAKLDYSWNALYGTYIPPRVPGLGKSALAPAAISFSSTSSNDAASLAERTVSEGYGAYLTYNLGGGNRSTYVSAITEALYGQAAIYH